MGVYPLLADDTCWLLAIDLDGRGWRSDVDAIRAACDRLGVVATVERSRSGEGAHVWFFFEERVPAALARRFGLMLLTDAMARRPSLGMTSYDRLFPSQDVLPKAGFGNLIALPLQKDARHQGNTVFVDDQFEPFEDQWAYLEATPRIACARLQELVACAAREGRILGVSGERGDDSAPWRSARSLCQQLTETKLPRMVRATLANRLYVALDGLPPVLTDAIRRLAVFSNPRFLELQAMRMSTARTPRVIACFEQTGGFLALPRGCREPLEHLLEDLGVALDLSDERTDSQALDVRFTGELTSDQERAVPRMLTGDAGVLCAPPGSGKTVIAARLIAERRCSTLVLVHRRPLLDQWVERLDDFLDVGSDGIGTIVGGRERPTGRVDVAMVQSLARHNALDRLLGQYSHVVVDECHHVPAVTTERVLRTAPARYVTGLTATPKRRDGHHPIITMQCGPIRHTMGPDAAGAFQSVARSVLRRETRFDPRSLPTDAHIQEVFGALAADEVRTGMIAEDARELAERGRRPIVLTERREHLERLACRLADTGLTLIILHGEMRPTEQRTARERLAAHGSHPGRVVLATGRYVGEGFDDPSLDALLLGMPIAWKGTVIQYAGRLHRAHPGKHGVLIYDYVDAEVPVLRRMFAKRLRAYRTLGYELEPTPMTWDVGRATPPGSDRQQQATRAPSARGVR
jgi:superfamily II DNA or RNA helicase